MQTQILLKKIQEESQHLVWWKTEQIIRGEHLVNDPRKGERPWIIPETTGQFLCNVILENKCTSVLELGTSIGYSTLWIADALSNTNGHVHTIEISHNKIPIAQQYFNESGLADNITLHQGAIGDILQQLPASLIFDCVFMDADRGHYHEYFHLIKKHLDQNAVIIADNAGNMNKRMQPFLNLLKQENISFEIQDIDNGILIAKMKY